MKINNKRGVSEVVASVLLILLVIASIVILWAVYQRFIEGTTEGIADSGDCIQTDLDIVSSSITAGADTVRVKRNLGSATITDIRVLVNGAAVGNLPNTNMALGEERDVPAGSALANGQRVEVAATINGVVCSVSDECVVGQSC